MPAQIPLGFDLDLLGFAIVPDVLAAKEIATLLSALAAVPPQPGVRKKSVVYAIRNLLNAVPEVSDLASDPKIMNLARQALGPNAFPVRATLFDKTSDANWLVPWHQDLTICVKERRDVSGYGPWTIKAGVPHVQPPAEILESMLAIRIHLDDCDANNGALRVLPATHRSGRLTPEQIEREQQTVSAVTCPVPRGGVLLLKPLLLHASSAAAQPSHRRVIHIDFASSPLPAGLSWFAE